MTTIQTCAYSRQSADLVRQARGRIISFTETVWSFDTARFRVELRISEEYGYRYDGDDPEGETQRALDDQRLIAFDSQVIVLLDGNEIGSDSLGGSVYSLDTVADFWQSHWKSSADGRNTLAMKAKHMCVCHYFPDMVKQAIATARKTLCDAPKVRCSA